MILGMLQKQLSKEDQQRLGIVSYPDRVELLATLTFHKCPTVAQLEETAERVADMAKAYCQEHNIHKVLIGGANYLTPMLVHSLLSRGLVPVFLWIERVLDGYTISKNGNKHGNYTYKTSGTVEPYTLEDVLEYQKQC